MKVEDLKRYHAEIFNGLYPLIAKLLNGISLTDKITDYEINGQTFLIRKLRNEIEMGLPRERSFFPTLVFKMVDTGLPELSYFRIGEDFKSALFQATDLAVRGKGRVFAIFRKELTPSEFQVITYESRKPGFDDPVDVSTMSLSVKDLYVHQLGEYWDKKQPFANKLISSQRVELYVYFGENELISNSTKYGLSINDKTILITWCVDSLEYLTSIATGLKLNKNINVKVDLAVDDFYFAEEKSIHNLEVDKISLAFNLYESN